MKTEGNRRVNNNPATQRPHWHYATALFFLFIGVYLLTYRGFPLSQDSYFIFDSTESFVRRGDFYRTYEFAEFNPTFAPNAIPWGQPLLEPLNAVLLAPFFWVGEHLPTVGTMHVTWLFNIAVTALTGVSLFYGTLLLAYTRRTAWIGALLYGFTTLAWIYSRHLFREPLMTLVVFWCFVVALLIGRQWNAGKTPWRLSLLLGMLFVLAFLTKAVSMVLLPGFLIAMLPSWSVFKRQRRLLFGIAGVAGLFVLGIAVILVGASSTVLDRYSLSYWLEQLRAVDIDFVLESLIGYEVSFSRSIWIHSPILLAGVYGAWLLIKRGEWRVVASGSVMLIALSAAYGIGHKDSWWGSWGWGPRYMLPLIPILMLWVLPVIEARLTGWRRLIFWLLALMGVFLQLLGMAVRLPNYYTDLNRAGILTNWDDVIKWGKYNWSWEWSPIKYHLERFDPRYVDIAWWYVDSGWIAPALIAVLIAAAVGFAWWVYRNPVSERAGLGSAPTTPKEPEGNPLHGHGSAVSLHEKKILWVDSIILLWLAALAALTVIAAGGAMYTLRADDRYIDEWTDVRELARILDEKATSDQVIFIDRDQYKLIFMNYFKTPALVAVLPYAPGENYSGTPEVISDDPLEQIGIYSYYAIDWTAQHYDETWLVASSSPFEVDKMRPVERHLVRLYYPVEEITVSNRARAIRFLTVDSNHIGLNEYTDFVFDEHLSLEGFNLPLGTDYAPGDVLPVTLSWIPLEALPDDYNVSVQVATLDGFPVAQQDGQPQGTFGKMSAWAVGERYLDNHGIQLPPDIPPGEYAVQVVVYRWQNGQRLQHESGDVARIATIQVK